MKDTPSSRTLSPTRTSLNIMFFLLMIVYSPCAWPALALAADSEPMASLPGGVPPQASQLLAAATPAPAGMLLRLRIYLNLSNTQAARQMTDDLQNPSSPNYHKWLKTGQFNQMFGPLQASYDAIASWLTSQGFTVTAIRPDRRDVEFSGTVAQADQAFQVQIMSMSDGKHYGILSDPMIPTRFQGVILGVMGLDNLSAVSPASTISPVWTFGNSKSPNGIAYTAFAPADFYTFYDENALLNAGVNGSISGSPNECLAILGVSDYLPAAVTQFDNQFNLSAPAITTEYATILSTCLPGPFCDPGLTEDVNEVEAELDLEWGHAAAPGAPLIFYVGDTAIDGWQALLDALELTLLDNTCGTISISFQICDFNDWGYYAWDLVAQEAAAQGQSIFVASGDDGSAGLQYDPTTNTCVPGTSDSVNEISADTYVTSVGGTQFHPTYPTATPTPSNSLDVGFGPEGVWDVLGSGASGGGESQYFPKPNYQVLSTPADGARDVPDVALMAGALDANGVPNPGAFYGDDPQISGSYCPGPGACVACCTGGTSLATILWAGISKLIQQQLGARLGNINPELYSLAGLGYTAGLRDVTANASPNNNGYNGVVGWSAWNGYDLATGWGTPDITTLVNLFGSSQVVLIGGLAASEYLQTAEAYNPVTQSFTSLGTVMSANRVEYGAAKLADGTILLAGGNNRVYGGQNKASIFQTADIFNPVTDTFTVVPNNMQPGLDFATAIPLDTGKVFIIGSEDTGSQVYSEIYDPAKQTFSKAVKIIGSAGGNAPNYTSTLLGNGKVLIQAGGNTAQLYDPVANTFTETANQPPEITIPGGKTSDLQAPAAVLLSNGMVLVAGGLAATLYPSSFAYLYNPTTNTFAATGTLNQARCDPFAIALPNGEAMVWGNVGQNNVYDTCTFDSPTVEIYNPGTGTFTQAQMTTTRNWPYVSIIPNSQNNLTAQVLIAGGLTSSLGYLNSAEVYDPVFGTFTALTATMTTASEGGIGFALPAR